ncbi:response regulator [Deltaproteobacteria bacterium TL4]
MIKGLITENTKILVVEDEGITALDVERILKRLGYLIPCIVSSGEQAVEVARREEPDLILMDISLSGSMDGVEAMEAIKSFSDVPIVFFTANPDRLPQSLINEPLGFIGKPFNLTTLHATIELELFKKKRPVYSADA